VNNPPIGKYSAAYAASRTYKRRAYKILVIGDLMTVGVWR